MLQIHGTKVYICEAKFSAEYVRQVRAGDDFTETVDVHRYPSEGFDLVKTEQREAAYKALYSVLKHCISGKTAAISSKNSIDVHVS